MKILLAEFKGLCQGVHSYIQLLVNNNFSISSQSTPLPSEGVLTILKTQPVYQRDFSSLSCSSLIHLWFPNDYNLINTVVEDLLLGFLILRIIFICVYVCEHTHEYLLLPQTVCPFSPLCSVLQTKARMNMLELASRLSLI